MVSCLRVCVFSISYPTSLPYMEASSCEGCLAPFSYGEEVPIQSFEVTFGSLFWVFMDRQSET